MPKIYFVTSNKHKFEEVKSFLEDIINVEQLDIEVEEIQSSNLELISKKKALYAFKIVNKPLFVEDSGLFIDALKGFPGPYSSYVYKTIGIEGVLKLLKNCKNRNAKFVSIISYIDSTLNEPICFVGIIEGEIANMARGSKGFGFDPIFIPKGHNKTFAEDYELKKRISHRRKALEKFREFLIKNKKLRKLDKSNSSWQSWEWQSISNMF